MSHESISYARQITNELSPSVVNNYITQELTSQIASIDIVSVKDQLDSKLEHHVNEINQLDIKLEQKSCQLDSKLGLLSQKIEQLIISQTGSSSQVDQKLINMRLAIYDQQLITISKRLSDITIRFDQIILDQATVLNHVDQATIDQATVLNHVNIDQTILDQLASDRVTLLNQVTVLDQLVDTVKTLVDVVKITEDSVIVNKQLCLSDGSICGALYKKPDDYTLYWNTDIFETPVTTLQKYPFKSLVRPNDCVCLSDGYVEKITYGTWTANTLTEPPSYIVNNDKGVISITNDSYTCTLPGTYTNHWLIYDNSVGIVILLLVSNYVEILLLSSDLQIGYRSTIDIVISNRACLCLLPGQVVVIAHGCYKFFILLPSDYNRTFSISEIYIDNNCINCIDMQYDIINELVVSIDETITNNCCQLFDIVGMQLQPVFLKRLNINTGYKLCTNDYNYLLYYADGVVIFKIIDNSIELQTICLGHGVFKVGKALPNEYIGIVQLVNNYAYVCIKGSICYMETTADQIGKKIYFGPNCSYSTSAINSHYLIGTCINNGKILVGL